MATINSLKQSYQKSQIQDSIKNAKCLKDLISISNELLTLQEIQSLLLNKLNNIDPNQQRLNHMYFKIMPIDIIFSDDIICAIIQYLSINFMYNKLFVINKHFNDLMRSNPILYQQYIIKLKFCSKINTLYFNISHSTKSINISHFMENENYFPIQKPMDITSKYQFIWFCTKRLHIIPTTIFSTTLYNEQQATNNNGVVEILKRIISNAKSLEINDEFQNIKSDKLWMDWLSLDELFHIHSISKDLIYSSLLNHNLKYLNLTGNRTRGPTILSQKLLQLNGLLALKIDINNTFPFSNKVTIISFPINLEFILIENFNYYSTSNNYILNLSQCKSIIAISFKQVKNRKYILNNQDNPWSFARYLYDNNKTKKRENNKYDILSLCQCVEWPLNDSPIRNIGCLLFDNSLHAQSIQSLYQYFDSFTIDLPINDDSESNANNNNNKKNINVKYVRYIHEFEKGENNDDNIYKPIQTIIKNNKCDNNIKYCVALDWKNNDGLLWKLLLIDKYRGYIQKSKIDKKIAMYNKWFNMDIAKWIYHLGT